ncbi:MAG: methyl-accepting chemotaxis protein, partial [Fimbriimonadales bacterium]|nr:methyl-accepting chemotaxis protein [Fimbriimonadales bacterium]
MSETESPLRFPDGAPYLAVEIVSPSENLGGLEWTPPNFHERGESMQVRLVKMACCRWLVGVGIAVGLGFVVYAVAAFSPSVSLTTLFLAFGVAITAALVRTTSHSSTTSLLQALAKLAEGDLTVRLPEQGNSEQVALAQAFNRAVETLAQAIDVSRRASQNLQTLVQEFNEAVVALDTNAQQVGQASHESARG